MGKIINSSSMKNKLRLSRIFITHGFISNDKIE